jgi:hypothetical protein
MPIRYWEEANYWDGRFNAALLRQVQQNAGYVPILEDPEIVGFAAYYRNVLLTTTTLMVGATGTGKTITLQAALFAINASVNEVERGRPRAKHVLWLTTERTLRDTTRVELEDDAYKLGIVDRRPIVQIAKSYDDLVKGPAEITVATAQNLWKVTDDDKPDGLRRTDDEIRDAIRHWDVIVFDEGDWGDEQVQRIAVLASHALKFALTASPPISDDTPASVKKFVSRFVLINGDAVADYKRAVDYDGCLKELPSGDNKYILGGKHNAYESLLRGVRNLVESGKATPDHVSYQATILEAIVDGDRLERELKAEHPEDWWSPHIIVRLERIIDIKVLLQTLPEAVANLQTMGRIEGQGWEVTAVYQGHAKDFPADERDLSAKDKDGKWRHPFMRSRDYDGRADSRCKRVLLMINIGLRGLNNWPILFGVDCTSRASVPELIQFWGRVFRWPLHLMSWWSEARNRRYMETTIYVPHSNLTDDKKIGLQQTGRFIENMLGIVQAAGFLTWAELAAGATPGKVEAVIDLSSPPLSSEDKLRLMVGLSDVIEADPSNVVVEANKGPTIERLIDTLKPEATGRRRQKAVDYVTNLIDVPAFRREETFAAALQAKFKTQPVDCTTHLKPKDFYEAEELTRFVMFNPRFAGLRERYKVRIDEDDDVTIDSLSQMLRDEQRLIYREPPRVYKLQGGPKIPREGVLSAIASNLSVWLRSCGEISDRDRGTVFTAVNIAAQKVFGVDNAQNDGPLDQHAYHVAIMGKHRDSIERIALGLLAEWGTTPRIANLGWFNG